MKLILFNLVYLNPGLVTYKKTNPPSPVTQGQEVEFHEIEIGDRIIFWSWDRIILALFMRSNLTYPILT